MAQGPAVEAAVTPMIQIVNAEFLKCYMEFRVLDAMGSNVEGRRNVLNSSCGHGSGDVQNYSYNDGVKQR